MIRLLSPLNGLLNAHALTISRSGAALILAVGVGYALVLGDTLRFPDERDYVNIAGNFLEHGEFARGTPAEPTAYRAPGYPFLLAGLMALGSPIEGLRIANFVLLALSALLLSGMAFAVRARVAAALVPFVLLAYPLLSYTAGTLYPQTLVGFLLCLFAYALCVPPPDLRSMAAAGLTFGALILVAPIYLLLSPALLLWSLLVRQSSLKQVIAVCLVAGLVTAPWLARNYLVFGEFPLFGTNSGQNLLLGNSEDSGPNSGTLADISKYRDQMTGDESEIERNHFLMDQAVGYITSHPGRTASLYVRKFFNWFNVNPNLATRSEQNTAQVVVLALSYTTLLVLVLVRAGFWRRRPVSPAEGLSMLFYLAAGAAYAIFFTRIRFRVPSDLLLVLPAAVGASLLLGEITRRLPAAPERPGNLRDAPHR